jgi:hypothetical protein
MSARQVRRTFAAPFVVTLAGTASVAAVACKKEPAPLVHRNPPGPHENPPPPEKKPEDGTMPTPTPTTPDPATPAPGPTADAEKPPVIHRNPPPPDAVDSKPKPEPAKYEHRWTVSKYKGQADCQAFLDPNCPKPQPGKAMPTCNPPPPYKYACPDGFKEGDQLKIILRVGATECFVDHGPTKCPEGAKCNPPPPRKIACPQR